MHRLPKMPSSRDAGLDQLVRQVQTMVSESGGAMDFDARAWVMRWIRQPLPALGGLRPEDHLATQDGLSLISTLLARVQSAAYS